MNVRRRRGISEVMAAVITIAITVIAGAALFGYINGEAANSENKLGVANAADVNYLNERFVVVDMGFNNSAQTATLYLYNNGNVTLNLQEIVLHDPSRANLYVIFNDTTPTTTCGTLNVPSFGEAKSGSAQFVFGQNGNQVPMGSTEEITLDVPGPTCLVQGTTYYAIIVGIYGSTTVYYQCDPTSPTDQECTTV